MTDTMQRLYELYHDVAAVPAEAREHAIEERCDEELRDRLRELLRVHDGGPAPAAAKPDGESAAAGQERIGPYGIERVIDAGGLSTVYEAVQESPLRRVALKVLRPGTVSSVARRRFEVEAQLLARVHHPAIAQVFEAGVDTSGDGDRPFIAMELVEDGRTLIEHAEAAALTTRERVELLAIVCDAVEHAHRHGVIHRDLKPANILVDGSGCVKVLDFGIARATDSDIQATTIRTDVGQLIGTVPYMSPEQAGGNPHDLDTRTDVYSLGVVAYQLLSGDLPYDVSGRMIHDAVRVIREVEPAPMRSDDRTLRGDIETIVRRALEKDKARRYQSARDLGDDLRRHLLDEPIHARPPSAVYQMRKFAKRNRMLVTSLAMVLAMTLAATALTSALAVSEARARARAQQQERVAQEVLAFLNEEVLGAADPDRGIGQDVTVVDAVVAAGRRIDGRIEDPLAEASVRTALGTALSKLGMLADAEDHLLRAVELREAHGSSDRPLLEASMRLGVVYLEQQRPADAERTLRHARDALLRAFGPDDQATMAATGNLAIACMIQGRPADAEPLMADLVERQQRVLGADHRHTLNSMSQLGHLLKSQGRWEEAEAQYRDAWAAQREGLGEDHRITLTTLHNLAGACLALERTEEGRDLYRRTLDLRRGTLPAAHPKTLETATDLAAVCIGLGDLDEAESVLLETWRLQEESPHPHAAFPARVASCLVEVYEAWERPEDAARWRARIRPPDSAG